MGRFVAALEAKVVFINICVRIYTYFQKNTVPTNPSKIPLYQS